MGKSGGTKMHCRYCEETTVCAAIPLTTLGEQAGQRWQRTDHRDINWFSRGRECLSCGNVFITSEIDEKFIDELVELRDALGVIKKNAEKYSKEATQAASTLDELSKSLKVLSALKVYKRA